MSETTTAPSIPENALPSEPDYVLKKKFNPATIPAIFTTGWNALLALSTIALFVINIIRKISSGTEYIISQSLLSVSLLISLLAVIFLCVLMFIKVTKPLLSVPFFIAAFSKVVALINIILNIMSVEEFTAMYHSDPYNLERYEHYSYSDYMFLRCLSGATDVLGIIALIFAAVYVILAATKKENNGIKRIWFVPAIVYSLVPVTSVAYYIFDAVLFSASTEYIIIDAVTILLELLLLIPELVMILLLCKWISNPYKKVLKKDIEEAERKKAEKKAQKEMSKKPVQAAKPSQPAPPKPAAPSPQPKPAAPAPQPKPVSAAQKAANTVAPPPARPIAPVQSRPAPMQSPASAPVPSNQASTMAQKNNIELIKQYKELLDMGAISQEEYEEKKKKLLTD